MSLTVDSRANSGNQAGTGFTAPYTMTTFTVNNASPLIVAVHVQIRSVASITWNGVNLTKIAELNSPGTGAFITSVWCLPNPAAGNHNLVVTLNTADDNFIVDVISTSGGDTATGFRTASTRSDGTGVGPGLTLANSQNGDIVFHSVTVVASTITFDAAETTTSTTHNNPTGDGFSCGLSTKAAVGADTTVDCTDVTNYAEVAFAVIPAAAAAATHVGSMLAMFQ